MPMPGWWRHLNKRFFNPRAMKQDHDWTLLTHYGRKSGKTYVTPIDAMPVSSGGFATYLMYGRNTDWVKNVLASNSGSLEKNGKRYQIKRAQLVPVETIRAELPEDGGHPPSILRVKEMIRMDVTEDAPLASD